MLSLGVSFNVLVCNYWKRSIKLIKTLPEMAHAKVLFPLLWDVLRLINSSWLSSSSMADPWRRGEADVRSIIDRHQRPLDFPNMVHRSCTHSIAPRSNRHISWETLRLDIQTHIKRVSILIEVTGKDQEQYVWIFLPSFLPSKLKTRPHAIRF